MKILICLAAICLVAAQAFPDVSTEMDAVSEMMTGDNMKMMKAKSQGKVEDRTKLVDMLFKHNHYNKMVNPDDVKLMFGVALINFHVIESKDMLESYVWLRQEWKDTRLMWDPKDHGGVELIRMDAKEIWKPDVTLYNSADPVNMINCWHSNVLIYNTGKVLWVPPCKISSICHMHLKKKPYGETTCPLKFGSWTFDGSIMDLKFYKDEKKMDMTELHNTSGFEIVKNEAVKNIKHYSCCTEPYPDLTFNLTMKRIPGEELFKTM